MAAIEKSTHDYVYETDRSIVIKGSLSEIKDNLCERTMDVQK